MVDLKAELRDDLRDGQVAIVVGAGVAAGATGNAPCSMWAGLLRDGVARCEALRGVSLDWVDDRLAADDPEAWLEVAERLTEALGDGELRRWLRTTVGELRPTEDGVQLLEAVLSLPGIFVTTNYDSLLEMASGLPPVTWAEDGALAQRLLGGRDRGILHLHGHWAKASSVVLGTRSYEKILANPQAQESMRALGTLRTLVFVGFGAGIRDPNFTAFRRWMRQTWGGGEMRHYRLVLETELAAARAEHSSDERIVPLAYGSEHGELAAFLREVNPGPVRRRPPRAGALDVLAGRVEVAIIHGDARFGPSARSARLGEIDPPEGLIGRADEAALQIVGEDVDRVSRAHLVVRSAGRSWTIADASVHGTWHEGEPGRWELLPKHCVPVEDGMRLRLPEGTVLQFTLRAPQLSGKSTPRAPEAWRRNPTTGARDARFRGSWRSRCDGIRQRPRRHAGAQASRAARPDEGAA